MPTALLSYCVFLTFLSLVSPYSSRPDHLASPLISPTFYNSSSGLWSLPSHWWNSANAIEALCRTMSYTGSLRYLPIIQNTFQKTTFAQTQNGFYDDAQWWGIAWLRAYELTRTPAFLQRAIEIWNYVLSGWDEECGGGLWWSVDYYPEKNAITNELFLVFSSLLYEIDHNETYREWANKEWAWFESVGLINSDYLVNEGIDKNCKNNGLTTWTINQGVILGGLSKLYKISSNATLLNIAQRIAQSTMDTLVYPSGILREPCEPSDCQDDGPQFKGVFMRYLGELTLLSGAPFRSSFTSFVHHNADTLWTRARSPSDLCGLIWLGPDTQPTSSTTQTSALDAINTQFILS